MICPKCNQKTNHVINTKFYDEFNYLERERECRTPNCFNKFITYEQISPDNKKIPKLKIRKVKTRKVEPRTLWQEHRFLNYASMLIGNVFVVLLEYLKEKNLEEKFDDQIIRIIEIKNKDGEIYYKLEDDISGKIYEHKKRGLKSDIIRKLINSKEYWEEFKAIFKKDPSEEDKSKELQQFQKSIVHPKTGIMSEKYNLDFLKKNEYLSYWCHRVGDEDFWKIWTKLN